MTRPPDLPPAPAPSPAEGVDVESHAEAHHKTREARRTALVEDYVELIAELTAREGEARQVAIARRLGVAQPTVAKMLRRLAEDGLVQQKPYRGVFLTGDGQRLARECHHRHEIVEAFLRVLGVSDAVARHDAEGIEHYVSRETLDAFARHIAASDRP